jgi:hypothetical protein
LAVKHGSIFEGENCFHRRLQIARDARFGQVRVKMIHVTPGFSRQEAMLSSIADLRGTTASLKDSPPAG